MALAKAEDLARPAGGDPWRVVRLGRIGYPEACELQERLVQARADGQIGDTLLVVEHPPVFTIGRSGGAENILVSREFLASQGIEVFPTTRGGNITYHGPGQIVLYPIIDLASRGRDVHAYVRSLEEAAIRFCARCGIAASRKPRYTGVWVGEEKLAAIGVAIRRWVTHHGMAVNVNPDLSHFQLIYPCGIRDHGVTSLAKLLAARGEAPPEPEQALRNLLEAMGEVFGVQLEEAAGLGI